MFGLENEGMKTIGDVASICRGSSPRPISKYVTDDPEGVNWIKIGDAGEDDVYIIRTSEKITQDGAKKSRAVKPGDFILSNSMSFGRPYILGIDGCVHDGWLIISDYQDYLDPMFFYYELRSDLVQRQFDGSANGSTVKNLNSDRVSKVKIHIPSMELQSEFVELAKQSDKSQFIEMFGDIENNQKGYPIKQINEFSDLFAGATPSTKVSAYWKNGTIPWMSSGEVHMGRVTSTEKKISQLGYDKCSTKMVPLHTVVIALAGQGKTRGTVAVTEIELCTNQSLCAMVTDETVLSDYLYHNLRNRYEEIRNMCAIADGRGGLNLKIVGSIKVIVPSIEEQQQFVAFAEQSDKSKFYG